MKIRSKQLKGIIGAMVIVFLFGIVGSLEYRQMEREREWIESRQALEMQQEKIKNDIIYLQGQYEKLEGDVMSQGILIYDIRDRLHFTLFEDLELGVDW